jgi:opacity protein-like surface antigen
MKMNVQLLLLAIAGLSIAPAVQAEEISRKAADLAVTEPTIQSITSLPSPSVQVAQTIQNAVAQTPASNYWYVSGSLGLGLPQDLKGSGSLVADLDFDQTDDVEDSDLKAGLQGSVGIGYQAKSARAELEFAYSSFKTDTIEEEFLGDTYKTYGRVTTPALLFNGYWDIPTGSKARPYLGAGVGVAFPIMEARGEVNDAAATERLDGKAVLALQAKLGIQYEVVQKGNLFAEVKYLHLGGRSYDVGAGESVKVDPRGTFGVSVGYRQGF